MATNTAPKISTASYSGFQVVHIPASSSVQDELQRRAMTQALPVLYAECKTLGQRVARLILCGLMAISTLYVAIPVISFLARVL